jgi:hypothetical protein
MLRSLLSIPITLNMFILKFPWAPVDSPVVLLLLLLLLLLLKSILVRKTPVALPTPDICWISVTLVWLISCWPPKPPEGPPPPEGPLPPSLVPDIT